MHLHPRHAWDVTPGEAVALQKRLAADLITDRPIDLPAVRLVAGVDVSVKEGRSQAAIVVSTFPDFRVVETVTTERPTPFPYIPGLLSFREGPVLEEAFARLRAEPDVFLFDGTIAQNIAYARRDASNNELRAAAEAANATEFIDKLTDGMQTVIGERGVHHV